MTFENLVFEKKEGIAYITFNRPKVLNALNRKTIEELRDALLDAREDSAVRVLILTGAGEKSFVAGGGSGAVAARAPAGGEESSLFLPSGARLLGTVGKKSHCSGCRVALRCRCA